MRLSLLIAACALATACKDNPNIDGSKVPPSAANCAAVCARLADLCGYAPVDCTNDEQAGYCETSFTSDELTCMSTATSCAQVWDNSDAGCQYAPATDDDDASTDDAAGE